MNRRFFLKIIGSAIIGTAIALKIPDSLIPTTNVFEEVYKTCKARKYSHWLAQKLHDHAHEQFGLSHV